jgi:bifunctional DNase/RNase
MIKIELDLVAISHSVTHAQNYTVVLGEVGGNRRLPIVIGGFEAQAIAVAMEKIAPSRPLTHDLFINTLAAFEIELKEVIINNLLDGIFYAKLVCSKDGVDYEVDSRTSDAIALAVRFECPIYTFDFIMESASVELEETDINRPVIIDDGDPDRSKKESRFDKMSKESLENLLEDVLKNEDYEKAARIRDELLRRKSS